MIEFVAFADRGRSFTKQRQVRLSDADPRGTLRPDGVVRYLQDVATDDWSDVAMDAVDTWVVRRTEPMCPGFLVPLRVRAASVDPEDAGCRWVMEPWLRGPPLKLWRFIVP